MITTHRVSMAFARLKDCQIGIFAGSVILGLTNNLFYPDLPVSLADLSAATDNYRTALANSMLGGVVQTSLKKQARSRLIGILRDEAHYVQIVAKTQLSTLLSSGFTAIDRNTATSPLAKPLIKSVLNQYNGQLWLRVRRVPNARSYQVRLKIGDGEWLDGGIHPQARKIVLPGLTPGTIYMIQVRALGGSTGYSDWSMAAAKMAT
ncbi:MAG TPA: fibronectin type III domain-containing protein [Candidatus Limnocylindrales bacterium]|nr:fibronectin type III domain-containing protein [Candidatus Limnocylindrales bacterium]